MQKMPNNTNINVDVRTGAFEYHAVDLVLPAPGFDLRFERWHSSTSSLSLQDGWRFDWDERLEFDSDGSVRHYRGLDVMSRFVENVDGTFSPAAAWVHSSLERVGERFLLELPNLDQHAFNASHGRLLSREDAQITVAPR